MTSTLDRLGGASRDDVLPGYVLSEPRLWEIGACESAFQRQYLDAVTALYPGDTEAVDAALAKIESGALQYGAPDFSRLMREELNPALMLRWCLWRYGVTVEQASTLLLAAPEPPMVMAAVYDLWGFVPRHSSYRAGKHSRIDWKDILRRLRKLGLTREQAMGLTWAQALNELGCDEDSLPPDVVVERKLRSIDKLFDKVCTHLSVTPDELSTLPPQRVTDAIAAVHGSAKPNPAELPEVIRTYQQRKGCARG